MKRTIVAPNCVRMWFSETTGILTHEEVISADSLKTLTTVHFTEPSLRAHALVVLIIVVICLILRSSRFTEDEATATVIHSL
jgi:hypothetical protein